MKKTTTRKQTHGKIKQILDEFVFLILPYIFKKLKAHKIRTQWYCWPFHLCQQLNTTSLCGTSAEANNWTLQAYRPHCVGPVLRPATERYKHTDLIVWDQYWGQRLNATSIQTSLCGTSTEASDWTLQAYRPHCVGPVLRPANYKNTDYVTGLKLPTALVVHDY